MQGLPNSRFATHSGLSEQQHYNDWRKYIIFVTIFLLMSYQWILCFINTRITAVPNVGVIAAEALLLIVAAASVDWFRNVRALYWIAFVALVLVILATVRASFDPQALRNVLIMVVFFQLGKTIGSRETADRFLTATICFVIVVGLVEYFLKEQYLQNFDILKYYISRGLLDEDNTKYLTDNLFASGNRAVGRSILPFLGDHRVSSIFLEPVSMGNFAVVVAIWGLSFDAVQWRRMAKHLFFASVLIVFCDSRFASLIIFGLVIVRLLPFVWDVRVIALLPCFWILGLVAFTLLSGFSADGDDLPTRLQKSGEILLDTDFLSLIGFGPNDPAFMAGILDSGISVSILIFGVPLMIFLWITFVLIPVYSLEAIRYRALVAVYSLGILTISGTSFYSSKTAAILWFLFGALARVPSRAGAATLADGMRNRSSVARKLAPVRLRTPQRDV